MDLQYILLNSLVYGIIALALIVFFAYWKFLNLTLWVFVVFLSYIMYFFMTNWVTWYGILVAIGAFLFYLAVNYITVKCFTNAKQRDLFGLIFTLWATVLLENSINYIFGPNSVWVMWAKIDWYWLLLLFVWLNMLLIYFFRFTYFGCIFRWLFENQDILRSLGVKTDKVILSSFVVLVVLLSLNAYIILAHSNVKSSDHIFYILKWIGIMILVWISKIEYVFIGALLYVVTEYIIFIKFGIPISYKETMILIVILLVLILKPNWIFTFKSRNI